MELLSSFRPWKWKEKPRRWVVYTESMGAVARTSMLKLEHTCDLVPSLRLERRLLLSTCCGLRKRSASGKFGLLPCNSREIFKVWRQRYTRTKLC